MSRIEYYDYWNHVQFEALVQLGYWTDFKSVLMESEIVTSLPDNTETAARNNLLQDLFPALDKGGLLAGVPGGSEIHSNELLRAAATTGGIGLGSFAGRAMEWPLEREIAALVTKYPQSSWKCKTWIDVNQLNPRMRLDNVVSWGSTGSASHPEAATLLRDCKTRGLKSGLYASIGGAAINYALDKTFFSSSHYGMCSATFDSVGVFAIAAMPVIHPLVKTAAIVAGHAIARKLDNYESDTDRDPDRKDDKLGQKLGSLLRPGVVQPVLKQTNALSVALRRTGGG